MQVFWRPQGYRAGPGEPAGTGRRRPGGRELSGLPIAFVGLLALLAKCPSGEPRQKLGRRLPKVSNDPGKGVFG